MPRSFNLGLGSGASGRGPRFWLQVTAGVLAVLNGVALYLLLDPPGGSRRDLLAEGAELREQIAGVQSRSQRLRQVSAKVQLGSEQSGGFQTKYILPKRHAYQRVITELQRLTKISGLQERDAAYSEEPIEGTPDLTLLTSSANYEGTYESLRRFLAELDHSPLLIMLDNLQAAPQQKGAQINTSMRFQTIMQEDQTPQPAPERGQP